MHTITQDVLLSVLAIARPAPFLPSVCQDWTCLCQSESHIRRSWLHQLVFKSQLPLSLTDAKAFANSDAPIPRFQQFLMSRLPNGPNRREYETIVADFLGPSGLFAREQSLAVTKCPLETPLEAALSNWLETSSRCTQRWHPVSDSIICQFSIGHSSCLMGGLKFESTFATLPAATIPSGSPCFLPCSVFSNCFPPPYKLFSTHFRSQLAPLPIGSARIPACMACCKRPFPQSLMLIGSPLSFP
ncbi:hypothetical protein BCR44DRAFT_1426137, partial [Catenaria anguillulae PL171]